MNFNVLRRVECQTRQSQLSLKAPQLWPEHRRQEAPPQLHAFARRVGCMGAHAGPARSWTGANYRTAAQVLHEVGCWVRSALKVNPKGPGRGAQTILVAGNQSCLHFPQPPAPPILSTAVELQHARPDVCAQTIRA
jgi:hypothetical protein